MRVVAGRFRGRALVAPDDMMRVWLVRGVALCVPVLVLLISTTSWFDRCPHVLLALVGAAAGVGLMAMQVNLPVESASYYYPMMVLVTFYTYNFIGTRFIYALGVDLALLAVYNVLFGLLVDYPLHTLSSSSRPI